MRVLSEQLKTNSEKLEGENAKLKDELEVLRLELSKLKEKEDERNKQWAALLKGFPIIKNQNSLVLEKSFLVEVILNKTTVK